MDFVLITMSRRAGVRRACISLPSPSLVEVGMGRYFFVVTGLGGGTWVIEPSLVTMFREEGMGRRFLLPLPYLEGDRDVSCVMLPLTCQGGGSENGDLNVVTMPKVGLGWNMGYRAITMSRRKGAGFVGGELYHRHHVSRVFKFSSQSISF